MHWILYAIIALVALVAVQWVCYFARWVIRWVCLPMIGGERVTEGLESGRLLVVFGREVSRTGLIEVRFQRLLFAAERLIRAGEFDTVVLLGGDHHGTNKPYAETARQFLLGTGLKPHQIKTPMETPIAGRSAFSCSQELDVAVELYRRYAEVSLLGEAQRTLRYHLLMIAKGETELTTILVPSSESWLSWVIGLAVTLVDPNEVHVLRFFMRRLKRHIVKARDAAE